jgi:hypothetical protein
MNATISEETLRGIINNVLESNKKSETNTTTQSSGSIDISLNTDVIDVMQINFKPAS